MENFDPDKVNFEDYLHVEGVQTLDPYLPAFKTDGVRTKNIKLILAYLEKKAIEDRLEEAKNNRKKLRDEEKVKIELQVSELPDWKQKLVREKLLTKLDDDLPPPETLTVDDLPPIDKEKEVKKPPEPKEQESKPIPAWKQRQLEREAKKEKKKRPSSRPAYMPVSSTAPEPAKFAPSPGSSPKLSSTVLPKSASSNELTTAQKNSVERDEKQEVQISTDEVEVSGEPVSIADDTEVETTQNEVEKADATETTETLQVTKEVLADATLQQAELNPKDEDLAEKPSDQTEQTADIQDTPIEDQSEDTDIQSKPEKDEENSEGSKSDVVIDSTKQEMPASVITETPEATQNEQLVKDAVDPGSGTEPTHSNEEKPICSDNPETATKDVNDNKSQQKVNHSLDDNIYQELCPKQQAPEIPPTAMPEAEFKQSVSDGSTADQVSSTPNGGAESESNSTNVQTLAIKEQTPDAPVGIEERTVAPKSEEQAPDATNEDDQGSSATLSNNQTSHELAIYEQKPVVEVSDRPTPDALLINDQDGMVETSNNQTDLSGVAEEKTQPEESNAKETVASVNNDQVPVVKGSAETVPSISNINVNAAVGEPLSKSEPCEKTDIVPATDNDKTAASPNEKADLPLQPPVAQKPVSPASLEKVETKLSSSNNLPSGDGTQEPTSSSDSLDSTSPLKAASDPAPTEPAEQANIPVGEQSPASDAADDQAPASAEKNEQSPASYATYGQGQASADNNEQSPVEDAANDQAPASADNNKQSPVADAADNQVQASADKNEQLPVADAADNQVQASADNNEQSPVADAANDKAPASADNNEQSPASDAANDQAPATADNNKQLPASLSTDKVIPVPEANNEETSGSLVSSEQLPTTNNQAPVELTGATNELTSTSSPNNEQAPAAIVSNEQAITEKEQE